MKKWYILGSFILHSFLGSGQQKDSLNKQHLVIKLAPLTYFGTYGAIQVGLETNITPKITLGFDYAYGDYNLAINKTKGTYTEGEICQRYRLDLRFYQHTWGALNHRNNTFWGVELFNRNNDYNTPVVMGRGLIQGNQYNYYENSSADANFQVWGLYVKYGNVHQLGSRFSLEYYGGLGLVKHINSIKPPATLGEFDRITGRGTGFNFWGNQSSSNFDRIAGDVLLSIKLNFSLF